MPNDNMLTGEQILDVFRHAGLDLNASPSMAYTVRGQQAQLVNAAQIFLADGPAELVADDVAVRGGTRVTFEAWWVRDIPIEHRADAANHLRQSLAGDGRYGVPRAQDAWEGFLFGLTAAAQADSDESVALHASSADAADAARYRKWVRMSNHTKEQADTILDRVIAIEAGTTAPRLAARSSSLNVVDIDARQSSRGDSAAGWCETMERPKARCGCPDCGPALIDLGPGLRNSKPESAPDGWVLIPMDRAAPTPDYDECARQATLASGLPSLRHAPWMSTFIREINRWCQHRYANVAMGLSGLNGGWRQDGGRLFRGTGESGHETGDEINVSLADGSHDKRALAARAAELREKLNRVGPPKHVGDLIAEIEWCIAEGSGGLRTRSTLMQAHSALQSTFFAPSEEPR
ncbi:hypothetical protein [Burkholderia ubonensis]|uniref:hypothetical protein n=1 Tax=Burkholderia ubonensis TaxID=101571 RepID=UPI000AF773AE|nr:hypothetical protein [Burkholderia ubonensis]